MTGRLAASVVGVFAVIAVTGPAMAEKTEPHFYSPDDPALKQKLQVESFLGLFFIKPPRRHVAETVEIRRDRVSVRYWYSLGPQPEAVACDGLKWLLFGRHQWAGGARKLFEETEHEEITLEFGHVSKPRQGQDIDARDFRSFMETRISRRKAETLDYSEANQAVEAGEGCMAFMRRNFDRFRFDARFYRQELKKHNRR